MIYFAGIVLTGATIVFFVVTGVDYAAILGLFLIVVAVETSSLIGID